jgi:uncharacterized protein YndB with AHSA1/START domain
MRAVQHHHAGAIHEAAEEVTVTTQSGGKDKCRGALHSSVPETETSEEAIMKATGHSWSHWFKVLDRWHATRRTHKEIAAFLQGQHRIPAWWSQTVTVEYERARGMRRLGQTADGAYQIGVVQTMDMDAKAAWDLVSGPRGLRLWLGPGAPKRLEEGVTFELEDGTRGEVRVVKEGQYTRLTWQPSGWEKPSVVQVRVLPRSEGRAAIQFHHEKLPGAKDREVMRAHWKEVLRLLDD